MLSIFLALFIHMLGYHALPADATSGPADRAAATQHIVPPGIGGHHMHTYDTAGGPAD